MVDQREDIDSLVLVLMKGIGDIGLAQDAAKWVEMTAGRNKKVEVHFRYGSVTTYEDLSTCSGYPHLQALLTRCNELGAVCHLTSMQRLQQATIRKVATLVILDHGAPSIIGCCGMAWTVAQVASAVKDGGLLVLQTCHGGALAASLMNNAFTALVDLRALAIVNHRDNMVLGGYFTYQVSRSVAANCDPTENAEVLLLSRHVPPSSPQRKCYELSATNLTQPVAAFASTIYSISSQPVFASVEEQDAEEQELAHEDLVVPSVASVGQKLRMDLSAPQLSRADLQKLASDAQLSQACQQVCMHAMDLGIPVESGWIEVIVLGGKAEEFMNAFS